MAENRFVIVDVGGQVFKTTRVTLEKSPYFKALMGMKLDVKDECDYIFLDRDPDYFKVVLEYLRSGDYVMKSCQINSVIRDLNYFGFDTDAIVPSNASNLMRFDVKLDDAGCWKVCAASKNVTPGLEESVNPSSVYAFLPSIICFGRDHLVFHIVLTDIDFMKGFFKKSNIGYNSYFTKKQFDAKMGYAEYVAVTKYTLLSMLYALLPCLCDNFHIYVKSEGHIIILRTFQK